MVKEMKKESYTQDDYNLVAIDANGMNFLALEKRYTTEWFVFDWDLSGEEVQAIKNKFQKNGLTEYDFQKDIEWEPKYVWETDWVISFDRIA